MKKIITILMLVAICATVAHALTSSGTGSCSSGRFSVSFSGAKFVTGLGWSSGSTSRTISWSGSCSGCSWGPAVYGWMQGPLVEYYIPRSGGTSKGTYSADGRTYTLGVTRRYGQPSIEGTKDFDQYFAGGGGGSPVNFGQHTTGWRNLGVSVGSQNYQVVAVENWSGGSGSANVSVPSSSWYTHWIGSGSANFTCGGSSSSSSSSSSGGGSKTIVVRACESGSAGSGAQIRLTVNNQTVQTWTLTSTSMQNFTATTSLSGGCNVAYINDATNRDVRVDYITVNGSTRQAESQSTNTAVYQNSACGGSNSEWMHCNGYIGFGNV